MCGTMRINGIDYSVGATVPVHGTEQHIGKGLSVPWIGWCRRDSLKRGLWDQRRIQHCVIEAEAYFERGLLYPIDPEMGIAGVLADDTIHGGRGLYVVTRLVTQKEIDWALEHGTRSHDRHPVFKRLSEAGLANTA